MVVVEHSRAAWAAGVALGAFAAGTVSGGGLASPMIPDEPLSRDEVRAIAAEVLDDARTRSSLLAELGAAGHDGKNFYLASGDGAFRLSFRGQVQFRYLMSFRDEDDGDGDGTVQRDFEPGFQTRRTKLIFDGSAWEKNLTYRVQAAASRGTGDVVLEDSWVAYAFENGVSVTAGQFKLPFLREELLGSSSTLAVDQTSVYEAFTADYGQGVQLGWTGEDVRVFGAFSDGVFTRNSDFGSDRLATPAGLLSRPNAGESDFAVTCRAEFKHGDGWARFRDNGGASGGDAAEGRLALLIGVAGHVEGGDASSSGFTTGSYLQAMWTVDATVKGDGWALSTYGVGSYSDLNGFAGEDVTNNDHGIVTEVAFRPEGSDLEPYFQYQVLIPDTDRTGGGEIRAFNSFVVGANYYVHGHAAKFTADVVWRLDDDNPLLTARTGSGYLGDDNPHEVTVRIQWQLLF